MSDDLNPVEEEPTTQEPESNGEAPPDLLWIREGADFVVTTIYIYQDPGTKRLRTILMESAPLLRDQGMVEYPVETRWSVPTKSQIDGYRNSASRYNSMARAVLVQRGMLEDLIVKNHLQEITLGSGSHQQSLELKRDNKGKLSEESMSIINQLHPSVIEMTLAKFIDDAALIL